MKPRTAKQRLGYRWISMSGFQPGGEWTTVMA